MPSADCIVVGGGIIGLSLALELRQRGASVMVIESGATCRQASYAAAGMLAARDPELLPELQPLADLSARIYPEFLTRIESLSGLRVPIRTNLTIQRLNDAGPGREAVGPGVGGREVSEKEALLWAPQLSSGEGRYILLEETSLDPRELAHALRAAVVASVDVREHEPVVKYPDLGHQENRECTIETGVARYVARDVIFATGAASLPENPAIVPEDIWQKIIPVKGQMVCVRDEFSQPLRCVVRSPEVYIVPRGDGRLIIGATVEVGVNDRETNEPSLRRLIAAAAELLPGIEGFRRADAWAGVRPGTVDGLPLLGPIAAGPRFRGGGYWIATGHFRNGILLAPGTARVMADAIFNDQPAVSLQPFLPTRAFTYGALAGVGRSGK